MRYLVAAIVVIAIAPLMSPLFTEFYRESFSPESIVYPVMVVCPESGSLELGFTVDKTWKHWPCSHCGGWHETAKTLDFTPSPETSEETSPDMRTPNM